MTIFGYLVGILFWAFVVAFGILGVAIVVAALARVLR